MMSLMKVSPFKSIIPQKISQGNKLFLYMCSKKRTRHVVNQTPGTRDSENTGKMGRAVSSSGKTAYNNRICACALKIGSGLQPTSFFLFWFNFLFSRLLRKGKNGKV